MSELSNYEEKVKRLAAIRTGEPFYNSSPDHAALIVEQLFLSARNSLSLLSDDLDARVYGRESVVEAAGLFLTHSNHKLRLLIENLTFKPSHPFLEMVKSEPNVQVRQVCSDDAPYVKYNFAVADDDSYRYEPDSNRREAIAAFGDRAGTDSLLRTFDAIWNRAEPIDRQTLAHHTSLAVQ